MKTLRRPMFRKGGNVGDGIMTGIVDRSNYKVGSTNPALNVGEQDIADFISLVRGGGQDMSSDPATDFLLQFGPNLLTQTPQGSGFSGLIRTSAAAAKDPIKDLIKTRRSKDSENIALRAKAIDTLGTDNLAKIRKQAEISVGPQMEMETTEEYNARLNSKMKEFIDSTYRKPSDFLKTDSPEEKVFSYAETMVKSGDMKDMPTAKNRANFELSDFDKLKAAKVNIQLPRAKKLFSTKRPNLLKRNVAQGVYYDDITDTYTRVIARDGKLEYVRGITFEELIQN